MAIDRREFIVSGCVATVAVGATALLGACGEEGSDPEECGDPVDVEITTSHPHTLNIPFADVMAMETKTYTITGDHSHEVTVTADLFEKLMDDRQVGLTSEVADGHMHQILLTC